MERLLETWPVFEPGVESRYFSSFDRAGGNDDGFVGTYSALYVDENGEHVIFEADQPGCLYTLWFTSDNGGHGTLNWGRIRFYFDGEKTPRAEMDANELFKGDKAPFLAPLVANNAISTGGFVSYVPMPFAKSLKITTERRAGFYNCFYQLLPHGTTVTSWTGKEDTSKLRKLWRKALDGSPEGLTGKPAEVKNGTWSHEGSGVVTRLEITSDTPFTEKALRDGRVVCEWDGVKAVDVPLGMLFGLGIGPAPIRGLAVQADPKKLVSLVPMPFRHSARITITSPEPVTATVSLAPQRYKEGEAGTLHAVYSREWPTKTGIDFELGDLKGAGKVIGVVQAVEPGSPEKKWWWEGDVRVYTDGALSPAVHGTGHEDDYLGGWSNEFLEGPYTLPMHGEPFVRMLSHEHPYSGDCGLYRFFPGVTFGYGIRWSTEHSTENEHNYNYSSVLFWYAGGPSCVETDAFVLSDPVSREKHKAVFQNLSDPNELTSTFEGRDYKKAVTDTVFASLGKTEFDVTIDAANHGVKLRRRFDQFHGRQRARVLVDGTLVGTWYTPEENRHCRWAERDFFIPAAFTAEKSRVRITLDPPAASPLFSHARYTVFSLLGPKAP